MGRALEKDIENDFVRRAKKEGFKAKKFVVAGEKGVSDRIVFIKPGITAFIEFKRPGGKPSYHQEEFLEGMHKMGFPTLLTTSADEALQFCRDTQERMKCLITTS